MPQSLNQRDSPKGKFQFYTSYEDIFVCLFAKNPSAVSFLTADPMFEKY